MVEIDMTKEPTDGFLVGINLWEVVACKSGKSQAGDAKLEVKFRAVGTETEMVDHLMLVGKGWGIGRAHLTALGLPLDFKGALDPLDFIGKKLWLATHVEERPGVDRATGEPRKFKNLRVDIDRLAFKGYQPEADVPVGCVAPTGMDGMGSLDAPF